MHQQVLLATLYLPAGLAGAGLLALTVGGVIALLRRRPSEPPAEIERRTAEPEEPATERELVTTGGGAR